MDTKHLITCSDEILSGIPVFAETRVPVKNLMDYLRAGDRLDDFLDDFPSVSRTHAQQVLFAAQEALLAPYYAHPTR
jgi:uncharacterized protein (DUF433 family)